MSNAAGPCLQALPFYRREREARNSCMLYYPVAAMLRRNVKQGNRIELVGDSSQGRLL